MNGENDGGMSGDSDGDKRMGGEGNRGLKAKRLGIFAKFGEKFLSLYSREREREITRNMF